METQQLVDAIRQNLQAGHSEASIRAQLLVSGWAQDKADEAFRQYYREAAPVQRAPAPVPTRKVQQRPRPLKQLKKRWVRASLSAVAVGLVMTGVIMGHGRLMNHAPQAVATVAAPLSMTQKQSNDVIDVAGAIGQYVAANNNVQPNKTAVTPDGRLRLCTDACDSNSPEVSPLFVYTPAGVMFTAYAPGLVAPDIHTMYIVPAATCEGNPKAIVQSTSAHSVVILYAVAQGSGLNQHCVQL